MYGQLTTGTATIILSRTRSAGNAHRLSVQIDTRANKPAVLGDEEVDWRPTFPPEAPGQEPVTHAHGTQVTIEMTAQYVRGRLSVDEYLKQCAVANPHLRLHFRVTTLKKDKSGALAPETGDWQTYLRAVRTLPPVTKAIQPHPHGVELGVLLQMLKDTAARTLKGALEQEFSRVSARAAQEICERAGLNPKANPTRVAHHEIEALFKAIQETKLMRPPTDCLAPIGENKSGGIEKFRRFLCCRHARAGSISRQSVSGGSGRGLCCRHQRNGRGRTGARHAFCQPRAAALWAAPAP